MKQRSESASPAGERKKRLRRILRKKRDALPENARTAKSAKIIRAFLGTSAFRKAGTIMFFMTHGSEVGTEEAIRRALKDGKTVAIPRTHPLTGRIAAVRIQSIDEGLVPGVYGIREPRKGKTLGPASFDLVVVPGLAFDSNGNRIGYGKGCYDRWLKKVKTEKRVALAYDLQVVREAPHTSDDLPVGTIITERRVINCAQKRNRITRKE